MKNIIFIIKCLIITATFSLIPKNAIAKEEEKLLVKLKPQINISPLSTSKYEINLEYLMPYLKNATIVEDPALKTKINQKNNNKKESLNFIKNFIVDSKDNSYVVGFEKKYMTIANNHDIVFVSGLAKERYYQYFFITPNFSYYHPDTGEYLGSDISIIGTAKIIKRGKLSSLKIESATAPIKAGAFVIPSKSLKLPSVIKATEPNKQLISGYILSTLPDIRNIGITSYDIVILSVGIRDGAKVGSLLKIKNKDLLLEDPYNLKNKHKVVADSFKGEVLIYNVFNKLSFGIIVNNSEEIKILDRVTNI